LDSFTYARRIPCENQLKCRETFRFWHWAGSFEVGICEDGSLKAIGRAFRFDSSRFRSSYVIDPVREFQVGTGKDWVSAVDIARQFLSLKADGTLWKWDFEPGSKSTPGQFVGKRMSERTDWVGIVSADWRWNTSSSLGIFALAADGSLWLWESPNNTEGNWLAPSRKPQYLGNIFDGLSPVGGLCEPAGGNRSVAIRAKIATLGGLTEATYRSARMRLKVVSNSLGLSYAAGGMEQGRWRQLRGARPSRLPGHGVLAGTNLNGDTPLIYRALTMRFMRKKSPFRRGRRNQQPGRLRSPEKGRSLARGRLLTTFNRTPERPPMSLD
jgi:hypothetical protein